MTGFVLVDKPEGITSFSVIRTVRRIFETKKCGHTGTLDPLATGALVIALGGATRFIDFIPDRSKEYEAALILGKRTDTLDITGRVTETAEVRSKTRDVEEALSGFEGEIFQLPPMFSAIKKDGKRLYELARDGIEVEREKRLVNIFEARLLGGNEESGEYRIRVRCSEGTYIRSLIDDLGEKLGCFAVMTELRRTSANGLDVKNGFSPDSLEEMKKSASLERAVIPVERLLGYKSVTVTEKQAKRFRNGGELDLLRLKVSPENGLCCVKAFDGGFCGIGEIDRESGIMRVKRVFVNDKNNA